MYLNRYRTWYNENNLHKIMYLIVSQHDILNSLITWYTEIVIKNDILKKVAHNDIMKLVQVPFPVFFSLTLYIPTECLVLIVMISL